MDPLREREGRGAGDPGGATDALLQRVGAAPEIEPPQLLAPGTVVDDTFVIEERLGAGGMGVVYRARDRRLGRDVALKLHLRASEPRAFDRLLREAQSLARLSHPNVVTVHEVGTYRDQLFIAMEYVEGGSLRRWLRDAPRTADEVLAVFVHAGRGLEAAHRAGLVHRDVKPDNIFLGEDGRALVGDFGLARAAGEERDTDAPGPVAAAAGDPVASETGTVLGTLAYMAPEQLAGGRVDARSDQFSFCAALWEMLAGELPFSGHAQGERLAAMESPPRDLPPLPETIARRVREALRRGLSVDPERRHPSMAALLAELEPAPRRSRAGRLAIAVAVAATAGLTAVWLAGKSPAAAACEADPSLAGLWTAERRTSIERSFEAAGGGHAGDALAATRLAGEYAAAIAADRERACRDTRVRRAAPESIYERRLACLHRLERGFRGLLAAWEQAGPTVVENAVAAAGSLPPVAICADEGYLLAELRPPPDPIAAEVDEVRASLSHAHALLESSELDAAGARLDRAVGDARRLEYPPLVAEALLLSGRLEQRQDRFDDAARTLKEAFFTARRSGHDTLAAEVATYLALVSGLDLADADTSGLWASLARVEIERGTGTAALELQVQRTLGLLADFAGRADEALEHCRRALDLAHALYGEDHPQVAEVLRDLARSLHGTGQYDLAADAYARSLAIVEGRFGPDHPQVAAVLRRLGLLDAERGEAALGRARLERALAIAETTLGPEALETGYVLLNLGVAHHYAGHLDQAIAAYGRALAIVETHLGDAHPDAGLVLNSLAVAHEGKKDFAAALDHHQRALAVARGHGPRHPQVAIVLGNIGAARLEMGEPRRAIESLVESIDIWEDYPERAQQAIYLTMLAEAQTQVGHAAEAVASAEAALARTADGASEYRRARTELALAAALWEHGKDRERALVLGRQAVARYGALRDAMPERTAAAEAWLAARER